jgi:endoglucanase
MNLRDIFLRLVDVDSPSGYEEPMMKALKTELEPLVDEVHISPRGNVVGVKKGTHRNSPSIAIAAHMDQVGFVVSNIDEKGFLRFRILGRPLVRALLGQHVKIRSSKGPVIGVIGMKPGHITTPEEARTVPPLESMYIDVGASSLEEVKSLGIRVGTPIVPNTPPLQLENNIIASPGADNKAGLTTLIAVAHELQDNQIPSTVYYVGTVEEEVGLKGAFSALYDLDVDMAVAIDTTPAGYQPGLNMLDLAYEAGNGPVIHLGEQMFGMIHTIHHHKVRRWLEEVAKMEGIPYQSNYMYTGTDATALARTRAGIPTIAVGISRRYSHSTVEAFYMKDLEDLVKILVAAVKGLDPGFDLQRV